MNNFAQDTDSWRTPYSSSKCLLPTELSDLTTGSEPAESLLSTGEPSLVREARDIISKIQNESIAKQTEKLLLTLDKMIQQLKQEKPELNIPPLHAYAEEDGSVLLEWIFPDFRVGFNVEPNADDSGWHLISNKRLCALAASGLLSSMEPIIVSLLRFAISNI
ncbi:MAG: hypothetical protein MUO97_05490 [Dehalococcoidia bacterium]|nr:hypothetical protein [Dehalococcoidia bacterium]